MSQIFTSLKQYLESQPDFSGLVLSHVSDGETTEVLGHFPDRPKSFSYSWKLNQLDPADDDWKQAVAKYIRTFVLQD